MDKSEKVHESQSDTSSVITMKEYAPSEYPSSEPPPAYMKPRSNALRIAKLAAFTVILSSIILGGFILAASWIQANTARNLDLTLNQELLDDLQPSYEHLIANEVLPDQQHNAVDQESPKKAADEDQTSAADKVKEKNNKINEEGLVPPPSPPSPSEKSEEKKVLDLDEIANILMQKNLKGNVNCIVEKRRNEELVDHAPVSLNLPSLNITTPPRLQHLTGEQMIVICKGDDEEDKESESDEEGEDEENKVDQLHSIVFPLPSQLLNQIQQIPQIIPLNNILQHIPMQQIQIQPRPIQQVQVPQVPMQQVQVPQVPVQQVQIQQVPMQQVPIQQIPIHFPQHRPIQSQQIQQQPPQIMYQQPLVLEQPQPQPQVQQFQQQSPQQVIIPQRLLFPQQQMVNSQPNVQFVPEMTPLKEVRINQERIPLNHVAHYRVPINPMAVNDVPLSRMPITHLPMRAEPQIREEPVPVHHLIPPQPQQYQAENFKQEEPKFNGPFIHEPINRFPVFPPQLNQQRPLPVEVRDPGVLRVPAALVKESRERFPAVAPSNQFFQNNLPENREAEFFDENPNRVFRQPAVDIRSRGQRKEPMANTLMPEMPKINPVIPLNFERRPHNNRRVIFPDMMESEEVKENRLPIITEVTKIIPIRLANGEPEENEAPVVSFNGQPKNAEHPDIKIEKMPPRPFPIPINAILDMIFRGIRPLMGNRGPLPIPIDIKIERIENKPLGLIPPFIKKFEVIKKEPTTNFEPEDILQNSKAQSISNEKNGNESVPDKDMVEAKIERVEIFDKENENSRAIPIPEDAQDPQVFKVENPEKQVEASEGSFEDQAFLPNGQGRGARVFPIPQPVKEAEIFSVFDAKSDKNMETEVPLGSSITVANSERPRAEETENGRGKLINFPGPILNFFPLPEEKIMKPLIQTPKVQPQTFSVSGPFVDLSAPNSALKTEEFKSADPSVEESRPHFVQPRSIYGVAKTNERRR